MLSKLFWAVYEKIGSIYLTPLLRHEYKTKFCSAINERPIEYGFAMRCLAEICPPRVLDVGSGKSAWPHLMKNCGFHVTAIDKKEGYWKLIFSNRHFLIKRGDITKPDLKESFDVVTCISVLEHIPNHAEAVKGMFSLLKQGGHLILTHPFGPKYIPNAYALPTASYGQDFGFIAQVFSPDELHDWLKENEAEVVREEYYEAFSGEFWASGERLYPLREVGAQEPHHLGCFLFKKK